MLEVTFEKLSDDPSVAYLAIRGMLYEPELGEPAVFVSSADGRRIITSPIISIFVRARDELYLRTANSAYRISVLRRTDRDAETSATLAQLGGGPIQI